MSEKIYNICLFVPLGTRDGTLYLREENGNVEGRLEVMNHQNDLTGTISEEREVVLYGQIETLMDTVSYTATGTVCEKKIFLNLTTESGIYSIVGEEVLQE